MKIELITVGDELLDGAVADGNAAWIGARLAALGLPVARVTSVRDTLGPLTAAIREVSARADVAVLTGGLGPTADDLTVDALAAAAGLATVHDARAWAHIEAIYGERTPPPSNRRQARCPKGGALLYSEVGTAPGVQLRVGRCTLFALPGVPREMRWHIDTHVVPALRDARPSPPLTRTLHFAGIGESSLAERVDERRLPPTVRVAWRSLGTEIQVRLRAADADALERATEHVVAAAPEHFVGRDGQGLVEATLAACRARGLKLATAESCTGGLVGAQLTAVAGSSAVFVGGVVAYSNAVKQQVLGVSEAVLAAHGAVSEACAQAMAEGARRALGADVALSITGVAGPGGGSPEKPVGTVCFGWAGADLDASQTQRFRGDRQRVRRRAAAHALDHVRRGLA